MSAPPPHTGYAFTGPNHLHNDIYPSINPTSTPSLHQRGKVVLITGAGRGIGRAIALQYAHAYVGTLILCARTCSELDAVSSQIAHINPRITVNKHTLDVSNSDAVTHLAHTVRATHARLDVLINNAGHSSPWLPITNSDPDDWWRTWEVNLKAPFQLIHAFLPLLTATAAAHKHVVHVLNISSLGAHVLIPGASAYQTSKLALLRLGEFVHAEYGDKGVNVVGVNPGGVLTRLSEREEILRPYLIDTPELCGGFVVWLTAEPRMWLGGRYVSATWDVDVLEGMKEDIVNEDKLVVRMVV
ncbi:putative oxidoreductase ucpA [Paraphoma chrysanthemicola]|uniref:Oxidoreductase ucpA n=1 Tax=Paraphoma chrysanthemicola TaxID=798071 RepID=A0A8K0VSV9_9PLEO|nr:putative oxidoreductase ucpA [Paraphoma chrysanthemicola]